MAFVRGGRSAATMALVTLTLALTLAACATSGERDPDRGACERLREHVVAVRLDGVVDDRDAHRAAAAAALGTDFVPRCLARTSRAELDCAMAATTLQTLRSCTPAR